MWDIYFKFIHDVDVDGVFFKYLPATGKEEQSSISSSSLK